MKPGYWCQSVHKLSFIWFLIDVTLWYQMYINDVTITSLLSNPIGPFFPLYIIFLQSDWLSNLSIHMTSWYWCALSIQALSLKIEPLVLYSHYPIQRAHTRVHMPFPWLITFPRTFSKNWYLPNLPVTHICKCVHLMYCQYCCEARNPGPQKNLCSNYVTI